MNDPFPLPPGSTIGILGGGQLGRMLAMAVARLGLKAHIYCPNKRAPAFEVADNHTIASFDDKQALQGFARSCDVITLEFENIPLEAADLVTDITPLFPERKALEISQDRGIEKAFLTRLDIAVAPWWPVASPGDLKKAIAQCGTPALAKTRRLGYDGKGQVVIDRANDPADIFHQLGEQPAIVEKIIPFEREISVILVRDRQENTHCYAPPCNHHQAGILRQSRVPCDLPAKLAQQAQRIAVKIASALDYTGVLAVEFFVVGAKGNTKLIVNEFAPRVHNTGHWTMDACLCDQFENHIRAIAGWPLGITKRHSNALMTNLLGTDVLEWQALASQPGLALHLYGKQGAQPGRKLGHTTLISAKKDKSN